jgi:hypothetical protein
MSNFKEGDKVVCIRPGDAVNGLIQDKVYTILNVFEDFSEAPSALYTGTWLSDLEKRRMPICRPQKKS